MALAIKQAQTTIKTASWIDLIAGIWLVVSPSILGYSSLTTATTNDVVIGLAVIVLSALRTTVEGYHRTWTSWINFALGVWLIFSPFIFGFSMDGAALWNNVILGIVVGGLALVAGVSGGEEVTG